MWGGSMQNDWYKDTKKKERKSKSVTLVRLLLLWTHADEKGARHLISQDE